MDMNIKSKFVTKLSLEDIDAYKEVLEKYSSRLPEAVENIVDRVSSVGLQDNYSSTEKLPIENLGDKVVGGIHTTDEGATYAEFGTGQVGSDNPHVAEWLEKSGWKYDINNHGEKGWVYYKDGQFHWTKGIESQKRFYKASLKMEESFTEIAVEELSKIMS